MTGTQVSLLAIPILAVSRYHATAWEASLLAVCGSLATLVFGLHAGHWADTHDRRAVMVGSHAGRFLILVATLALLAAGLHSVAVLCVAVFLVGCLDVLFFAAVNGYLPQLLDDVDLPAGNGWMQATENSGEVVGPGLAGLLISSIGAGVALGADAVSYAVAAMQCMSLPPDKRPNSDATDSARITAGLRFLWRSRSLRRIALAAAHFNFFTAIFFGLYVYVAVRILHQSPFQLGLAGVAGGCGGLLGARLVGPLRRTLGDLGALRVSYAVPGLSGLMIPAATLAGGAWIRCGLMCLAMAAWSCFVVVLLVQGTTIRQRSVPSSMLGRTATAMRFIAWGIEPIGGMVGASIVGTLGHPQVTMAVSALGCATSFVWVMLLPRATVGDGDLVTEGRLGHA